MGRLQCLGLRRSKPLFFHWEGAFLIQNSSTKDFQWALPHPHLTWGHSSAFQAYQWHVPIRAPIKSAPFPWNISKHFDGSGFPPAGFSGVYTPLLLLPYSHLPFLPSTNTTPSLGEPHPQHLPWRAVVTETPSETRGEPPRRWETCTEPFSRRSQRRWWEEDALRAAGGGWHGFHRSVRLKTVRLAEKTSVSCCWMPQTFSAVFQTECLDAYLFFYYYFWGYL